MEKENDGKPQCVNEPSPKVPFRLSRSGSRATKPHARRWGKLPAHAELVFKGQCVFELWCSEFWVRYLKFKWAMAPVSITL